jgi:hypothetical protein
VWCRRGYTYPRLKTTEYGRSLLEIKLRLPQPASRQLVSIPTELTRFCRRLCGVGASVALIRQISARPKEGKLYRRQSGQSPRHSSGTRRVSLTHVRAADIMSIAAVRRLEALFNDVRLDAQPSSNHVRLQTRSDRKTCDVHGSGKHKINGYGVRRGSMGSILHNRRESVGPRRESMPALNSSSGHRRKDSLSLPISPPRKDYLEHPSAFPSILRKDSLGSSMGCLRRDPVGVPLHREAMGSTGSLRKDSVGNRKDSLGTLNYGRRDSYAARRRFSTDSLDGVRRNSWDPGRRGSSGSSIGWDDPIWEEHVINKVISCCNVGMGRAPSRIVT